MHRFWTFPLILGCVAAVFPYFAVAQGWMAFAFSEGKTNPLAGWQLWVQMGFSLEFSAPRLVALGVVMGLVAAVVEMARFGRSDRSGIQAARRLFGNVFWLGSYALLVNASLTLVVMGLRSEGFSASPRLLEFLPIVFIVGFLIINVVAVLWATIRTAMTEDVLSPRVLIGKSRASTRALT